MINNQKLVFIFAIIVGFSLTSCEAPQDTEKIRETIAASNELFMEAIKNGDATALANLYTEDGQILPQGGDLYTGKEAIQKFWANALENKKNTITLKTAEVGGMGKTVYEVGEYEFTTLVEDVKTISNGKYIVIWKKVDGNWLMHRDMWNDNPPLQKPE